MPAYPRTTRQTWIDAGLRTLGEAGVDAVRVEALAAGLGVTKGGFYGHFRNRTALLDAMLDEWEHRATTAVIARVDASGGSAAERMTQAGILTFSPELLPIDLAVRAWAGHDPSVAERLRRVDNVRIQYLRTWFSSYIADPAEIEARSTLAFAAAIGHHLMAADHHPYTHEEAMGFAGRVILADPEGEL